MREIYEKVKDLLIPTIIFILLVVLAFYSHVKADIIHPQITFEKFQVSKYHVKPNEEFYLYVNWKECPNNTDKVNPFEYVGLTLEWNDSLVFLDLQGHNLHLRDYKRWTTDAVLNPIDGQLYRYVYTFKVHFNGKNCSPAIFRLNQYVYKLKDQTQERVGLLWDQQYLLQTVDAIAPKVDIFQTYVDGRGWSLDNNWVHICSKHDKIKVRLNVSNFSRYYGSTKWLYGSGCFQVRFYGQNGYIKDETKTICIGEDEHKIVEVTLDVNDISGPVDDKVLMQVIPSDDMYCYEADENDETPGNPPQPPQLRVGATLYQKSDLYQLFTMNIIEYRDKISYKLVITYSNNIEDTKISTELCKAPIRPTNLQYNSYYFSCYVKQDSLNYWVECENKRKLPKGTYVITYDLVK